MTEKTSTIVEIEALLRSGREVFLTLELPRDVMQETEAALVVTLRPAPGVVEEHRLPQAELAWLRVRTTQSGVDPTGMRTLGRDRLEPAAMHAPQMALPTV